MKERRKNEQEEDSNSNKLREFVFLFENIYCGSKLMVLFVEVFVSLCA